MGNYNLKGNTIDSSSIMVVNKLLSNCGVIVDMAYNDDGLYIKFSNKLLICVGRKSFNVNFEEANTRCFINQPFNFPKPFGENPFVIVGTANNEDYKFCQVVGVIRDSTGINSITCLCERAGSGYTWLHYIAIGLSNY